VHYTLGAIFIFGIRFILWFQENQKIA